MAVITGAASGIGSGLARAALARGMRVVLTDIDGAALERFAATLEGVVSTCTVDVRDPASVEALAAHAYATFGQVDLLFNNAGVLIGGKSWEIPAERWAWQMQVNVMGVIHGIASFLPRMMAAGRPARVINTGSMASFIASPYLAPYSASKFAVLAISETLALELQSEQAPVSVSILCPGPVQTEIFRETVGMKADTVSDKTVGMMRDITVNQGISPDELARRAFAGIDEDQFWIIPQPEILDTLYRQRADNMLSRRNPSIAMPG
ncbi:SDR family NAD(P)-dependent oxidoreductase [Sphingomonas sp. C3-2]|uniref:SDR family NAD(P)-dependent oxidoreductase n=1 Tax=Sphingomonas sp. C3-2 TaxID=3062169 RepID=UPI00294B1142|nr:SDR family NAD(P)-dependent oxidoreductase [Sphingomonas sp. C3-2]WOK36445.1 SDR family NAD(P)-dependent oxidoreductase [Sphingomonas sp. C3-2]